MKSLSYRRLAAARGCPPNALLVGNFFTPPAIEQVELSAYHGRAGDLIRVLATDTIEVIGVTVTMLGTDAAPLETGAATKDHDLWVYRSTTSPVEFAGLKIEITARNRAGAKVTASYPIS